MIVKNSVRYEIGFADSEIVSYKSDDESLIIFLKAWNEEILQIEFSSCILFLIMDSWYVSDLCEIDDSDLFQKALRIVYEKVPADHGYKLFQFFNYEGDTSIEIACKDLKITRVQKVD